MSDSKSAIDILTDHFNENGWPEHVGEVKFIKRSETSEDRSIPGCEIVEVERHRPILGDVYIKDLGMAAYETYLMRYSVNLSTLAVERLSDNKVDMNVDIPNLVNRHFTYNELVYLSIDQVDDAHYKIGDSISGTEVIITDIEEANDFIVDLADPIIDTFQIRLDLIQLSAELKDEYLTQYMECVKNMLKEQIIDLWEEG